MQDLSPADEDLENTIFLKKFGKGIEKSEGMCYNTTMYERVMRIPSQMRAFEDHGSYGQGGECFAEY